MNKKGQGLFWYGAGSFGLLVGIILVVALLVGYSLTKTGTPLDGINGLIEYIMQDPIAAGVIFLSGIILGKVVLRTYYY
ncbi:MAG TPA: hypothetical protein EYH22_02420 [Candidatus Nanopusillus sp.]|nr:hypothetical protein [Candidatus Nanopusillus sp.]